MLNEDLDTRIDETNFPDVLARARAGDGAAWFALYEWLAPGLAAYLRLEGRSDADDLTRTAFVSLVRRSGTFKGTAARFRALAFVDAHRRLHEVRRNDAAVTPLTPWSTHDATVPACAPGDPDTRDVLEACGALSDEQREVLYLRVVAALSLDQTASVLGRTRGVVHALQAAALVQLQTLAALEPVAG